MKNIVILLLIACLLLITSIFDKLYYATYITISNIEETAIHYTIAKLIIGIILCILSMILIDNENWLWKFFLWLGFILLINVIIICLFIIVGFILALIF